MPKVNMEGVPVGFQIMPDTERALGKFTGFVNGKTKNNDVSIRLEFTVDEPTEHAGHKLFNFNTIIPTGDKANLHFFKEVLVLMGAAPEDLEGVIDTDEILNDLLTNEVAFRVSHREHEGRTYNDIKLLPNDGWQN